MMRPAFSLPPLHALATGAAMRALNHLLDEAEWARALLRPHAGRVVALEAPLLPGAAFGITAQGGLAPAAEGSIPDATLRFVPGRSTDAPWSSAGEPDLAATLDLLARHLRWDGEDALARWIGDIPARRTAQAARRLHAWQRDTSRRMLDSAAGYLARERGLVLLGPELQDFGAGIAALEAALEALETRVARLEAGAAR